MHYLLEGFDKLSVVPRILFDAAPTDEQVAELARAIKAKLSPDLEVERDTQHFNGRVFVYTSGLYARDQKARVGLAKKLKKILGELGHKML